MRFSLTHKLTSYLMVLASVSTLWFSPELSLAAKLATLAAILLSWFAEPDRFPLHRLAALWNVATLLFFVYLGVNIFHGGSVVTAGVYFLLFVLINKLFNRSSSKDYRQAYVISFLILVAATTLNTDITYAVCFFIYVVLATWTLTLFHLRREMEENYLLRHSEGLQSEKVEVQRILNSRRIVGLPFLAGTSLISVGVLAATLVIFLIFPRVGFGLFLGHRRAGTTMVGFRERVELGHHGVIRDNPRVVLRVLFPRGQPKRGYYWRGSIYDHYDHGVWSLSKELRGRNTSLALREGLYMVNHAPGLPYPLKPGYVRRRLLKHVLYLEPLDSTVIFAADRAVALEVPEPPLGGRPLFTPRRDPLTAIRGDKMRTSGVRYTAYSHVTRPREDLLRRAMPLQDPAGARFLQLPHNLPARVGALARRITRNKRTIYEKVMAVQDYLRKNYAYTLKLTHDARLEPVDEFLFVTRKGHCEYFASAMALLLRHLGIHTRQVNGFVGGVWNGYGKYLGVRQGDAHAWVEVLFSTAGWVTIDPTPPGNSEAPAVTGWGAGIRQLVDALRMRWFRYVVEYDLGKQVRFFREVKELFSSVPADAVSDGWLRRHRTLLLLLGVALAALIGLLVWRRRRRFGSNRLAKKRVRLRAVSVLYQRMLNIMARAGHLKQPGDTPLEFARSLSAGFSGASDLVRSFTLRYYGVRFGKHQLTESDTKEMESLLQEMKRRTTEAYKESEAPEAAKSPSPGPEETQRGSRPPEES